ncbi:uncharacterized protein LOC132062433 [Lycium ferocissimum]|uniref:uncharacterized protein LOC132062433 n=1 Tax=Lycium ferocissimum TaxID=112874 RepID=UPI002815D1B5|nr:uncharacterized protein LOC132062433 [Lycium ferocissimum]
MERVSEQLECSDTAKFKYADSLLQKDAYDWWVSVPNAKAKPPVLTWNDFVKEFHMKYVPPAYNDVKKKEFLNLEQGSMSIAEYQQKFLRLSRYAGGIINNEKDKCRRFEDRSTRNKLVEMKISSEKLMHIKEVHLKGEGLTIPKPVVFTSQPGKQNRSNFSTASTPSYGQGKSRIPTCAQCGKNHSGTCRRASGAYFNCGSLDHKVKDYPNPNPTSSPRTEGSVQKPITTPSQGNRGARSRNIQATGAGGANQASGLRVTA